MEIKDYIGMQIVESTAFTHHKQYRFPRSKRKRIRKKWSKRPDNWKHTPDPNLYSMAGKIYGHPMVIAKLRQLLSHAN